MIAAGIMLAFTLGLYHWGLPTAAVYQAAANSRWEGAR